MRTSLCISAVLASVACLAPGANVAQAGGTSGDIDWCTPYPQQCFGRLPICAHLQFNQCVKKESVKIYLNGIPGALTPPAEAAARNLARIASISASKATLKIRRDHGLNIRLVDCGQKYAFNTLYAEACNDQPGNPEIFSTVVFFFVNLGRTTDSPNSFDNSMIQRVADQSWTGFQNLLTRVNTMTLVGPPSTL